MVTSFPYSLMLPHSPAGTVNQNVLPLPTSPMWSRIHLSLEQRGLLCRFSRQNPLVNLTCPEFPQTSEFVGGHRFPYNPFVDGIPVDTQVGGNLLDRQPSFLFFHRLLPETVTGLVGQYRRQTEADASRACPRKPDEI
jgi:hypothetical protein